MNTHNSWPTKPYYKTIMRLENSTLEAIISGMGKKGYDLKSVDKPITEGERKDIFDSLPKRTRNGLLDGDLEFIPKGKAVMTNGRDRITAIDFDIREGQRYDNDPIVIVWESVPNTTSLLVREILDEVANKDAIAEAFSGVFSDGFKASVTDIARLTGEDPNVVYNRCINKLVSGSIYAMRGGQVHRSTPIKPDQQHRTPWEEAYNVE